MAVAHRISVNGVDRTSEIERFAEAVGLHGTVPGRYSALFVLDLFVHTEHFGLNPYKVMDEVMALEEQGRASRTKPPAPFKHPPLRSLYHKHYVGSGLATLSKNIWLGLGKRGVEQLARSHLGGREMTSEAIGQFAHEITAGTFERRARAGELTGEWIIFANHEGQNFYLSLGGHHWGDGYMASRIREICLPEFAFLSDYLWRG